MAFEHVVTVRFQHVDRAGIAFFGQVFEYCHAAYEEMLVAAGLSLREIFDQGGWGMPLVHAEADYSRPMRMGDRLAVALEVARIGRSSLTFEYTVRGAEGRELRATVRLVHAFIDLDGFRKLTVPPSLVEALARLDLVPVEEGADGGT